MKATSGKFQYSRLIGLLLPFLTLPFYGWVYVQGDQLQNNAGQFVIGLVCVQLVYLATIIVLKETDISLKSVLIASFLSIVMLLPARPTISTDLYRYIWDGRVTTAGYNVFLERPDQLSQLQNQDELYKHMNYREEYTVYPPLAQALFVVANVAYEHVGFIGAKIVMSVPFVLILGILWKYTQDKKRLWVIAVVALNPLVLFELFSSGHIDGWFMLLVGLAYIAYKKNLFTWAAIGIMAAALIKVWPIILLPVLIIAIFKRFSTKIALQKVFQIGCICSILMLLAYAPFIQTSLFPLTRLASWAADMRFNSLLYTLAESLQQGIVRLLALAILMATIIASSIRLSLLYAWIIVCSVFLLITPVFYPWYALVMFILTVMTKKVSLTYASAWLLLVAGLTYIQQVDNISPALRNSVLSAVLMLEVIAIAVIVYITSRKRPALGHNNSN